MKSFFFGLLFLGIVAAGGYYWVTTQMKPTASGEPTLTQAVTLVGNLRKATVAGQDYTHQLVSDDAKIVGIASYAQKLDDYVGKKVEVSGQYSGTTLYIDSIQILP